MLLYPILVGLALSLDVRDLIMREVAGGSGYSCRQELGILIEESPFCFLRAFRHALALWFLLEMIFAHAGRFV